MQASPVLFAMKRLCLSGDNRNEALVVTASLELYSTVNECVEGVIRTHTHVLTGMMNCTSLTYDDVASLTNLTTEDLYTESLTS